MATTQRKIQFGEWLATQRLRAGKSLEDVAEALAVTATSVGRYESGSSRPSRLAFQVLVQLFDLSWDTAAEGFALWEDAGQRPTRIRLPGGATKEYRALVRAESEAVSVRTLQPIAVPGLLQTPAYAEALMQAGHRFHDPNTRITQYVAARMKRQKRLEGDDPLHLHVLLDEAVIRRPVGGPVIMAEQIQHLLTMSERANVTVQLVPLSAGAYATMAGSFTVLSFPRPQDVPCVYLEHSAGGEWIDNQDDVKRYEDTFGDVATEDAWSPEESTDGLRRELGMLKSP
ncbi:helix-turn-helix domain-containing protein [Amycolatopsis sp. NPDC059021]|uniref:helix-turn-helix domain-containing protein n=1 Tax=Amycolatopsis sp. NPDC059021 TaxID=3346704 RepID=UPI00366A86A6